MAPDITRFTEGLSAQLSELASTTSIKSSPKVEPISKSEKRELLSRLEGKKLLVPDLISLLPGWRYGLHPDVDPVNEEIDEWLKTVKVEEVKKIKHRARGNYTWLTATYYSDAPKEKLLLLSQFLYWIFFWDDEIDTGGQLTQDRQGTVKCCEETNRCVEDCLGPNPNFTPPPGSRPTVEMFYPILTQFRQSMGAVSIERLRKELHDYINGVSREQVVRQKETLPTPAELFKMRCDDVGVIPSITQNEYAMDFELPQWIHEHEAMQEVIKEVTRLTILINDILSLQKEFRVGQLENMVILYMYHEGLTLEEALDVMLDLIREHYVLCTAAEQRIPKTGNLKLDADVQTYIVGCRDLAIGTAYWSYNCERYFKFHQINEKREVLLDMSSA
ncbi:hypothetical protein EYB26_008595 [Talaromyces marneffei]|uniref:uncharacterized protein n=1 Tax=Talaromyces marneffei TaxID=37727 RepID=UPI0012A78FB3|nr:uncharacterized protein EYB26_008595 [Talaromyces marneffei]QGA20885.1 hypothetical protein EYB26_008595 [Talaromyces marneffei]